MPLSSENGWGGEFLAPRRSVSERIHAHNVIVPVPESTAIFVARFVVVRAPLKLKGIVEVGFAPRGQISERFCQQIVEISAP